MIELYRYRKLIAVYGITAFILSAFLWNGYENGNIVLNPLYVFEEDENSTLEKVSGRLKRTKNPMKNDFKLLLAGTKIKI